MTLRVLCVTAWADTRETRRDVGNRRAGRPSNPLSSMLLRLRHLWKVWTPLPEPYARFTPYCLDLLRVQHLVSSLLLFAAAHALSEFACPRRLISLLGSCAVAILPNLYPFFATLTEWTPLETDDATAENHTDSTVAGWSSMAFTCEPWSAY
jgi:hypothetical protein